MNIKTLLIYFIFFTFPLHAEKKAPETWIEVELIAFKNQNSYKERVNQAQNDINMKQNKNSYDLITPFIYPDISAYIYALSACSIQQLIIIPEICKEKEKYEKIKTVHYTLSTLPKIIGTYHNNAMVFNDTPYLNTIDNFQFLDTHDKLKKIQLEILLHISWKMPLLNKKHTQPFLIYGGQNFQQQYHHNGTKKNIYTNRIYQYLSHLNQKEQDSDNNWELSGYIDIYINRYLFIDSDLILKKTFITKSTEDNNEEIEDRLVSIPLKQTKQVRFNEIHYLDNPHYGIIIQLRKTDNMIPQKTEETVIKK